MDSFTQITRWYQLAPYAGRMIAYKSSTGDFGSSYRPANDETRYAFVSNESYKLSEAWDGSQRRGYQLTRIRGPDDVPSTVYITDDNLHEDHGPGGRLIIRDLSVRFATLAEVKAALLSVFLETAKVEYTWDYGVTYLFERHHALANTEDLTMLVWQGKVASRMRK